MRSKAHGHGPFPQDCVYEASPPVPTPYEVTTR